MEDESNPWPSFVDTFSTVLCIFIFLMLVFALNNMLVMYDNSIKVYKTSGAEISTLRLKKLRIKKNL
ncbi:Putative inner membrane or exported protein [Salmonella enterica subsp. arizonae]|uniref:Inner membrane or exported protein n=1 Tax=Salmonella enterica subsp. arizonae TaxID=59203 RepID=A0A379TMG6_SALER|nr:Putative inner membrane or exported protein [Salmonella enterica subsp. arizonae]